MFPKMARNNKMQHIFDFILLEDGKMVYKKIK